MLLCRDESTRKALRCSRPRCQASRRSCRALDRRAGGVLGTSWPICRSDPGGAAGLDVVPQSIDPTALCVARFRRFICGAGSRGCVATEPAVPSLQATSETAGSAGTDRRRWKPHGRTFREASVHTGRLFPHSLRNPMEECRRRVARRGAHTELHESTHH